MVLGRCPGSMAFRQPKPEIVPCPNCGADVEIWTDEAVGRCLQCSRQVVRRKAEPSCAQWCTHARECLGDAKLRRLLEMMAKPEG